ncbi:MAG: sulfotransferase, partial [Bryobacteraceae bacterium]|nr:sulfotransferase [Bryobacteraceae bacterium]
PPDNKPGIIILGMHRSGTSLIAQLVHRWGAYAHEDAMLPGDVWNPNGYMEPAPLVRFNDELLGMLQSRWNVPPHRCDKPMLAELALQPELRARAQDLIGPMLACGRPWFWKDPRLAILLPFWKQLWGKVVYIIPVREPGDIAISLGRRDGFSMRTSLVLWHRYMSALVEDRDVLTSSGMFLRFEDLLSDPITACRRIAHFLDLQLGNPDPKSDDLAQLMAAAVEEKLWRSRSDFPLWENPLASEAERSLYATLLRLTKGDSTPSGNFPPEPHWREVLIAEDLMQRTGVMSAVCKVYWSDLHAEFCAEQSNSVPLTMDGSPQHVRVSIPPWQSFGTTKLRVDFVDRPAIVWLTAMELTDSEENVIWAWDRRVDSIVSLAQNDVASCNSLCGESGCVLQLNGYDPWIVIVLDFTQSAALKDGAGFAMECSCSASVAFVLDAQNALIRHTTDRLQRLEGRQTEMFGELRERLREVESLKVVPQSAPHENECVIMPSIDRLQQLEAAQIELCQTVHNIVNSRSWKTLVAVGGLMLRLRMATVNSVTAVHRLLGRPKNRV